MAETFEGSEHVLRKGFPSEDHALDHPVKLSLWRRVWVRQTESVERDTAAPERPFSVKWEGRMTYLVDATGKRIACFLGTFEKREKTAAMICEWSDNV